MERLENERTELENIREEVKILRYALSGTFEQITRLNVRVTELKDYESLYRFVSDENVKLREQVKELITNEEELIAENNKLKLKLEGVKEEDTAVSQEENGGIPVVETHGLRGNNG